MAHACLGLSTRPGHSRVFVVAGTPTVRMRGTPALQSGAYRPRVVSPGRMPSGWAGVRHRSGATFEAVVIDHRHDHLGDHPRPAQRLAQAPPSVGVAPCLGGQQRAANRTSLADVALFYRSRCDRSANGALGKGPVAPGLRASPTVARDGPCEQQPGLQCPVEGRARGARL
jgi:hypothetical protein